MKGAVGEPGRLGPWTAAGHCLSLRGCHGLCLSLAVWISCLVTLRASSPVTSSCCHGACHGLICLWSACVGSVPPSGFSSCLGCCGCSSCHTGSIGGTLGEPGPWHKLPRVTGVIGGGSGLCGQCLGWFSHASLGGTACCFEGKL